MGELDLLKPTIERKLNGTIHFGRVAMKPGKPTTFASVLNDQKKTLIFALPGNPASALVCFHLFVLPSIRKWSGRTPSRLPQVRVQLQEPIKLDSRPEYHRAFVLCNEDGRLVAISTGFQRSSRVGSLKKANALLCLPAKTNAMPGPLAKNSFVDALLLGPIESAM